MSWQYIVSQREIAAGGVPTLVESVWTQGNLEDCLADMFDHMAHPLLNMTGQRIERKFVPQ